MLANSWEGQFTLPIPLIAAACAAGSSSVGDAVAMPRSTSPTTSESERHALDSDATAHLTSLASMDLTRLNSTRTPSLLAAATTRKYAQTLASERFASTCVHAGKERALGEFGLRTFTYARGDATRRNTNALLGD